MIHEIGAIPHLTLDETDAKKALIDAEAVRSFVLTHLKK